MLDVYDLTGAVALVTGGNRGIGRGIALALACAGADIALAARDQRRSEAVVAEVRMFGRQAVAIPCDVTRREELAEAVERTVARLGKLTIVVNNAGIAHRAAVERHPEREWDGVLETNLKGALFACQAAYPALIAAGGGKIINISSAGALIGMETQTAYGASKAALVHLTKSLATAWARQNIQVNAVLPGVVRTEMWEAGLADPVIHDRVLRHTPAGRVAEPEEIGAVTAFLASRAADFITGQALVVDGGITVGSTGALFTRD